MLAPLLYSVTCRQDHETEPGSYLTDGTCLYRRLESFAGRGVVALENCRSLELVLCTPDEIQRLRPVPAVSRAAPPTD